METKTLLGAFVAVFIGSTIYSIINLFIYTQRSIWQWLGTGIGLLFNIVGIFAFYEIYRILPSNNGFKTSKEGIKSNKELLEIIDKI